MNTYNQEEDSVEITYFELGLKPGCYMSDIQQALETYKQKTVGKHVTLVLTEIDVATTDITICNLSHVRYTLNFVRMADKVVLRLPGKADVVLKDSAGV